VINSHKGTPIPEHVLVLVLSSVLNDNDGMTWGRTDVEPRSSYSVKDVTTLLLALLSRLLYVQHLEK